MFISVTTIPAAAALGLSLAYESWSRALGSTWQLLLNVGLLIVVGAFALRLQRRIWRPRRGHPCRSLNLVIDVASGESVRLTCDG